MPEGFWLLVVIIFCALAFDFINGFHDTANAIATVVSTRVMTPRTAIMMAAVLNFVGALISTKVATTIAKGIANPRYITDTVVLAAVIGAIIWNLITWKFGIPSSSSHALIGGLCGAAVIHAGLEIIYIDGVIHKVIIPMVLSPVFGFGIGFILMALIYTWLADVHPGKVGSLFRHLQVVSAGAMAFNHGLNDAQKSMGIITLALVTQGFLAKPEVPVWVVVACATAMALGTSAGGWRIIRTMGHQIIRLEPVHGFAAETSASITIFLASHLGMPVSTTHVISGSIVGVGAAKRINAVRWTTAQRMVIAWVLTLPTAAAIAAMTYALLRILIAP
jgi:PiT family inorganic phosphate transporter